MDQHTKLLSPLAPSAASKAAKLSETCSSQTCVTMLLVWCISISLSLKIPHLYTFHYYMKLGYLSSVYLKRLVTRSYHLMVEVDLGTFSLRWLTETQLKKMSTLSSAHQWCTPQTDRSDSETQPGRNSDGWNTGATPNAMREVPYHRIWTPDSKPKLVSSTAQLCTCIHAGEKISALGQINVDVFQDQQHHHMSSIL